MKVVEDPPGVLFTGGMFAGVNVTAHRPLPDE